MSLADQIANKDATVQGSQQNAAALASEIAKFQTQQNDFISVLNKIKTDVITYISNKGDWVFTYGDFFISDLQIPANVEDWQVYTYLTEQTYTFKPPDPLEGDGTSTGGDGSEPPPPPPAVLLFEGDKRTKFSVGQKIWLKIPNPTYPIPYIIVTRVTYDGTTQGKTEVEIDITESELNTYNHEKFMTLVYDRHGIGWDNSNYLTKKFSDFAYAHDYIHHPYGETGTYGTKANIELLNKAKGSQEGNANKAAQLDSMSEYV